MLNCRNASAYFVDLSLLSQMLSMRNSLSQHPMFLSEGLQPVQALPVGIDFGLGANRAPNAVGMLPLNQVSSVPNTFDLSSSSNQSASIPSVINITKPETPVAMEPSQSHHGSFLLPVSIEVTLFNLYRTIVFYSSYSLFCKLKEKRKIFLLTRLIRRTKRNIWNFEAKHAKLID